MVEAHRHWEILNWLQYFSVDGLAEELKTAGFVVEQTVGSLDGEPFEPHSTSIGIIARSA
ncbi:MAG: hypothetical protein ACC642_03140 [Pseudomonadales bacterium]